MTTILFHAQDNEGLEPRLQDALALARASNGHLSCLHVTPAEAYVTFDAFGGVFVMNEVMDAIMEGEKQVRERVEAILAHEDVPWDYQQVGGPLIPTICGRAALADLLVTGRQKGNDGMRGAPLALMGDILTESRTPLFVPGTSGDVHDPLAPAVIGWNGSFEAANAVRGALPWLKLARSVKIVMVAEPRRDRQGDRLFPSTRLLEYLSRHDIHSELVQFEEPREVVAPLLVEQVGTMGAGTLVIGGYGHTRIGEYWFGGVTRDLLEACPVGMIVAH